ncbi:MAG: glycyl-radical enzyme activating protein [Paludibacterium sp.]|uniref:glycyl-radical enzyme activating protein n=1 Tax=Paludibacterium sp. TaxID=1917523 RepID=UPI0025DF98CF|nr:glycyl-radical enzyme activating protein [Paludibacterium sp.]MBV8046532.1 glycyl-radical enzyme activating protein [Paludibacterium sp.]MBV8649513.1 glycyl-radical enzyme activating protein [Paludibacterium sp.]
MIFNLQRYSTHDGPGIRTVVFFKGCTLACRWCQNPESRARAPELLFEARSCLAECALCAEQCPAVFHKSADGALTIDRGQLSAADLAKLDGVCPSQALWICGQPFDAEAILARVLRDQAFYQRTGGGLTLSGGEPFMQPHAAADLLARAKAAGIHTAAESCLHVRWSFIEPSLPHLDLLLADLKHVDAERFRAWTGGSARRVMDNFRRLARAGVDMTVRVPLIPDFNADEDSIRAIVDFAAFEAGVKEIHFLPYHTLGMQKFAQLGLPYLAPAAPLNNPAIIAFAEQYAASKGLTAILRG